VRKAAQRQRKKSIKYWPIFGKLQQCNPYTGNPGLCENGNGTWMPSDARVERIEQSGNAATVYLSSPSGTWRKTCTIQQVGQYQRVNCK
jgi:hypothetical protein